jgi:lysophospholipid acyltransferase (LPLAT)-like uncharacterized protein
MSDCKKTFKESVMINTFSALGCCVAGLIDLTVKYKALNYSPELEPAIYAIWHGRQFGLGVFKRKNRKKVNILISHSNDGQIITNICKFLGFSIIRGSHKRGGAKALRDIISTLENGQNIAYTVDGPKGPCYTVKEGIIKIAQLSKRPIIPLVVDTKTKIIFKSWDKYQIPLLFTNPVGIFGEPLYIPADADENQLEDLRMQLENSLLQLQEKITF